jgi:hypothetical protein
VQLECFAVAPLIPPKGCFKIVKAPLGEELGAMAGLPELPSLAESLFRPGEIATSTARIGEPYEREAAQAQVPVFLGRKEVRQARGRVGQLVRAVRLGGHALGACLR